MGSSRKAILVITLLLFSLFLLLCTTFAASGGRMGGNSFSKSKRSSSSSSPYRSSSSNYHHHHYHRSRGYSSSPSSEFQMSKWTFVIIICGVLAILFWFGHLSAKKNKGSVIMVQIGLTGKATSLQKELNEIAKTTDTSSSEGWKLILAETASALLRHRQYIISGYSSVNKHGDAEIIEKNFRRLSAEEREKIDMESLVNINNVRRQRAVIPKASKLRKDFLVVTVLIAAKGLHKVPAIRSIDDLKKVLRSLNFASEELLAVEVLWTPQDEADTLSEEELLEDYPLLRPI
ncbi:uncharacterized protein LOC8280926 [Ricinus communis]|uniref:Uncharacterized protein n=1 Tax=Ricinus communis TaxID=3988 RepID=B9RTS2_RICCO|nr:uncharacterized protein LOC8280926 [Ricinus communis]EEF45304.1 conserved hypothetical protein [Ricinus communis]|eukprot:XP_002517141.1 uncharacterized protein LOC8280926 [Ricinus communis]